MLKVGITGGIGSGKTSAAKMFGLLGVMTYFTDARSKYLINNNNNIKAAIMVQFGVDIYDQSGRIRSHQLADIIFNDKVKLKWLNDLMYPYIVQDFEKFCNLWSDSDFCMIESAVLIESGAHEKLDAVITVACPEAIRVERAMTRDGATREMIMDRVKNQITDEDRIAASDYVIWNNRDDEYLKKEVQYVYDQIAGN